MKLNFHSGGARLCCSLSLALLIFPHVKLTKARQLNRIKIALFLNSLDKQPVGAVGVEGKQVMSSNCPKRKTTTKMVSRFPAFFLSKCDFKIGENVSETWVRVWVTRYEVFFVDD